ncbi:MAG: HNH endonuclease [Cetobacterium sp.]
MKSIRTFKINNGMPELKIKPSRIFIPDMKPNQTPDERARFLMKNYQYTEVIFTGATKYTMFNSNKEYPDGLYIIKDVKNKKLEHFFIIRHNGFEIIKQDNFYVCVANGFPKKAFPITKNVDGLFELAVQIELGILSDWKKSFKPMELLGLSKGILNKYIKDGSCPKRIQNVTALNNYLTFIKMKSKIDKEVQRRLKQEEEKIQEIKLSNLYFKIEAINNGMPELKIKPSKMFIPDMQLNQTTEQRAKFLMSKYSYFLCKFNDELIEYLKNDNNEKRMGLYIFLDENNNAKSYLFLTNKIGSYIIKQDSYYIFANNGNPIRAFDNLFDAHVQVNITDWENWKDSFNPFELLGITEEFFKKYIKFEVQPTNVKDIKLYNEYIEYAKKLPKLENTIKEKQFYKDMQRGIIKEGKEIQKSIHHISKLESLPLNKKIIIKKINIPQRDRSNVEFVLKRENYTCQNNRSHKTYRSGTTGQQLMHVHHLIPMKYQYLFDFSLDVPDNMFSLCPNCHDGIHHGDKSVIKEILTKLYNQRGYKLPLKLEHILELYYK